MGAKARTTDWRDFEKAVAQFIAALNPKARVTHDARKPDRHTGRPRQRDVWIEGTFAGMFPLRALVSCKHYRRPLNQLDIDHFAGELASSGANIGIIYARRGFTSTAIAKAKELQIHCCRLYRNEPADVPETLVFASYCFVPWLRLAYAGPPAPHLRWADILDQRDESPEGKTLRESIVESAKHCDQAAMEHLKSRRDAYRDTVTVPITWFEGGEKITVTVRFGWKAFRGRVEANFLNGSYCQTSGKFSGSVTGPVVDLKMPPGPGWDPVRLDEVEDRTSSAHMFLGDGDCSGILRSLADAPLSGP